MFTTTMPVEQSRTNASQDNKRRRFAPNTLPVIAYSEELSLLDLAGQSSPSQQEIEAQLLQVGMRVRKSVADGYQAPGRRAFTPRPFMNFSRLSPETVAALSNPADASAGVQSAASGNLHTATFCGINLAMMSHITATPAIEEQKLWSYSTSSKRRQHFEEDDAESSEEEFMPRTPQLEFADAGMEIPQDYFNITFDDMSEVSPFTQFGAPQPQPQQQHSHNRKMAQPRSRIRSQQHEIQMMPTNNPFAQIAPPRSGFGHQRMRSCGMEALDFGEASFLQPRQDVDMDCS